MNRYQIWMTNFDYFHERTFETSAEAFRFGNSTGFEFQVYDSKADSWINLVPVSGYV